MGLFAVAGFAFGKDESKTGNPRIESRAGRSVLKQRGLPVAKEKQSRFGGLGSAGFGLYFFLTIHSADCTRRGFLANLAGKQTLEFT